MSVSARNKQTHLPFPCSTNVNATLSRRYTGKACSGGKARRGAQLLAQHRLVSRPAAAHHLPSPGFGQHQRISGADAFGVQRDEAALTIAAVAGGVDLAHARV